MGAIGARTKSAEEISQISPVRSELLGRKGEMARGALGAARRLC